MALGVRPRVVIGAYERQSGLCPYCMEPVTDRNATWEHIIPRSWGGPENGRNTFLACEPCNALKSEVESFISNAFDKQTTLTTRVALFILHCGVRFRTHKKKTTVWKMRYFRMSHHILEMTDYHMNHMADDIPELKGNLRHKFF